MSGLTQKTLNDIWTKLIDGKYPDENGLIRPERHPWDGLLDTMSIPNKQGTERRIYQRKAGSNDDWAELLRGQVREDDWDWGRSIDRSHRYLMDQISQ